MFLLVGYGYGDLLRLSTFRKRRAWGTLQIPIQAMPTNKVTKVNTISTECAQKLISEDLI